MLNPQMALMLEKLEDLLRKDMITPSNEIESGTFLCMTEKHPHGILYHQCAFDDLPKDWQKLLMGKPKGYSFGAVKVVAIFEFWPNLKDLMKQEAPPSKKLAS